MRCNVFWQRIITLCLTFWLGVFISDLFVSKDLPSNKVLSVNTIEEKIISGNKEPSMNLISKQRICVPADKNLKYRFLNGIGENSVPVEKIKEKTERNKNNTQKSDEPEAIKLEENRKSIEELEKQLYKFSRDRIYYQNLLHIEKCYESNGRK